MVTLTGVNPGELTSTVMFPHDTGFGTDCLLTLLSLKRILSVKLGDIGS